MPKPQNVYEAAADFVERHGLEQAIAICEQREAERCEANDLIGLAAWRAIRSAINDLQAKPEPGSKLH